MPEIQEYLPQVAVPEGVGGVSPNTELSSSVGRGLEAFGRDVSDTFTQIHSQNVAQSKADTFSYFSNLRADQTSQLQQQIQDGSLNTEKFLENYDNQTTDFGGNVETPEGRRFFERLQARTRGELLKNANFGMAQVSANRVKGQWQDGINKLSLTLENDPLQFGDVVSQGHEAVDEMIQAGGLPEKLRDKATQEMTSKFAESALIGHAQINPEDAMKMVHEDALGGYLTPEQRQKMVGIIHSYARDQKVEDERTTRAVEKEKKETQENWYQQNFDKITSGIKR